MTCSAGCITGGGKKQTGMDEFHSAESFFINRNYAEAIDSYRKALKDSPESEWAPDAKFSIASTLAFYDNPQRNFTQALQEFDEFLKQYPDHKRASEARNWRYVLKLVIDTRKENEHLKISIEQLKRLDIRHEEQRRK